MSVRGHYDLSSRVYDVSVSYAIDVGTAWILRPRTGVTYLRTDRDGLVEDGESFALTVALGMGYQLDGVRGSALAGYSSGAVDLEAVGAMRSRAVGTAMARLAYWLIPGLDLFSTVSTQTGRDDHRENVSTGMRLLF